MKCGHCHGDHRSLSEVKVCASKNGTGHVPPARPRTSEGRAATEKQVKFIRDLMEQRLDPTSDEDNDWKASVIQKLDANMVAKREASELIDYLSHRSPVKRPVEQHDDVVITSTVPNGTYTVVFGDGDRRTIRLRSAEWASDLPAGSQVAEFLSGPDNSTDFTGFAFVVKGRPRVWKRFKENSEVRAALDFLLEGGLDKAREYGFTYALASSRCFRCGHKLTVPASIHRGLGPVCAGLFGVNSDVEDVELDEQPEPPTCTICDGYHSGPCPIEEPFGSNYEEERMF